MAGWSRPGPYFRRAYEWALEASERSVSCDGHGVTLVRYELRMREPNPLDLLLDRAAASGLSDAAKDLVMAAAVGEAELTAAVGGASPVARPQAASADPAAAPAMFISAIEVEGFRGVGAPARLGLSPAPGLTLVVGRNGSGKSTFAEAAEVALTGTTTRWSGKKSKAWREGWANIHHDGSRAVELKVLMEGDSSPTSIRYEWPKQADVDGGSAHVQRPGLPKGSLSSLGIDAAMASFRPILSYNELGGLLEEGPSRLYDAISAVLGLDDWVTVQDRLDAARKAAEASVKSVKSELTRLHGELGAIDDERAVRVRELLAPRKKWDLDKVEGLVTGQSPSSSQSGTLDALVAIAAVDTATVTERVAALRVQLERSATVAGTDSGRARELADLLEQALAVHEHSDVEDCPVCGTASVLGPDWAARTTAEVDRLQREAREADDAARDLRFAFDALRRSIGNPPPALRETVEGVPTAAALERWVAWADSPDDPTALADHAEALAPALAEAVEEVRAAARAEQQRRVDVWQPVAVQVAAWLPKARTAVAAEPSIADLKAAAKWVGDEANVVRNERFAPIADRVREIWDTMRQTSNVSLDKVSLVGLKTRRSVELEVSVDEEKTAALSVMSQGELHTLALSLFIPRATLPASPFRFIVVDDPVQSMDAARVDGLARVLAQVAESRQVIVFTHDERLAEACRRLNLPARVFEVTRGDRSQVSVRVKQHPVDDYISDAFAVLKSEDAPADAKRRVIPGLCRNAIEAACAEAARRNLIAGGMAHADVDELLDRALTTNARLGLALFGDLDHGDQVLSTLNARYGKGSADLVQVLRKGAHEVVDRDAVGLIRDTENLADALLERKGK